MPYVMNYNNLIESIQRYVIKGNDTTFASELPRIIDNTERMMARKLKTLIGVKYLTTNLIANNPLFPKPTRWLETLSITIDGAAGQKQLFKRTFEYITTVYPDSTTTGEPDFYDDFQYDQFFVGKTPDIAYSTLLAYYERPEPLSEENQTNWLTKNVPDLLLKGVLLGASPFLMTDERMQMWQADFIGGMKDLGIEDIERKSDQSQQVRK